MTPAPRYGFRDGEVRSALAQFTLCGLLSLLVVGVTSFQLYGAIAREHGLASATEAGSNLSRRLLAPYATEAFVRGDAGAIERMDTVARGRMRDGTVSRIKIWTEGGHVLYSDEEALIGRSFSMGAEALALAPDQPGVSFVSDIDDDEHAFEDPGHGLVETYTKVTVPSGERLVFEVYYPRETVDLESHGLLVEMAPVGLAGLTLVFLAQLPLAIRLTRRLQRGRRDRQQLVAQSVAAIGKERQKLAEDLHDHAIQDLATVAIRLDAMDPEVPDHLRDPLRSVATTVRRDIELLRDIVTSLVPVGHAGDGLPGAIAELAEPLREGGIMVALVIDDEIEVDPVAAELVHRVGREAVANVLAHAHAQRVTLSLTSSDGEAALGVVDDGVGFVPGPRVRGHVGLALSVEAIEGVGGSVVIRSRPGSGTSVRARVPLAPRA